MFDRINQRVAFHVPKHILLFRPSAQPPPHPKSGNLPRALLWLRFRDDITRPTCLSQQHVPEVRCESDPIHEARAAMLQQDLRRESDRIKSRPDFAHSGIDTFANETIDRSAFLALRKEPIYLGDAFS